MHSWPANTAHRLTAHTDRIEFVEDSSGIFDRSRDSGGAFNVPRCDCFPVHANPMDRHRDAGSRPLCSLDDDQRRRDVARSHFWPNFDLVRARSKVVRNRGFVGSLCLADSQSSRSARGRSIEKPDSSLLRPPRPSSTRINVSGAFRERVRWSVGKYPGFGGTSRSS